MTLARWKDLCIDINDPAVAAPFWSAVLGLEVHHRDRDDMYYLTGPTDEHTVWLNQVPEPVSVKQRVHLDVHAGGVDEVLALGATPLDLDSFRWDQVRDPEGGELCVFTRAEVPSYRLYELGIDCADPGAIATWWGEVLGADAEQDDSGDWYLQPDGLPFDSLVFNRVPEPKTVKNRIHWDVTVADVGALTEQGATIVRGPDEEIGHTILADPEGNEFCAMTP